MGKVICEGKDYNGNCFKNRKSRAVAAFFMTLVLLFSSVAIATAPKAKAQVSGLPTNCVIGYWENWVNDVATMLPLRNVDRGWDVIIVSFMLTDSSGCRAVFSPDNTLYPGGESAFKADVEYCQARGQKVLISVGGATGVLRMNSASDEKTFYDSACAIIEKYGFDGIDIDLEQSMLSVSSADTLTTMATPIQGYMNTALHDMVKKFGSDFMVTMAPEHPYVQGGAVSWGGFYGGYLPLLNNCRDILTFIHPQYYNNPMNEYNGQWGDCPTWGITGYGADTLVKLSELLITGFQTRVGFFQGLRPDQVAFGVPSNPGAAGSGCLSPSEYASALNTLIKKYPTFRGAMAWSINHDLKNGNTFLNGVRSAIPAQTPPVTIGSVSADKAGTVNTGTTVTWTASASGGSGSLSYQFELYQNNILVKTQPYSSSNRFSAVLSSAGSYYVKVLVKDSVGTVSNKSSSTISAVVVENPLVFSSLTCMPGGTQNAGTKFTFYCQRIGRNRNKNFFLLHL